MEVATQDEFGFVELARDYFGAEQLLSRQERCYFDCTAHHLFLSQRPWPLSAAPAETMKAALAAVDRKRKQDELRQQYVDELKGGRAPEVIARQAITL